MPFFVNIRCGNILYHLIVCFCPVSLSLTSMSCFLAGRSRNLMLHWRLRVHHVRWLRPLLWRHIHSNSCRGNHSSGNSALCHRLDRVLRYDTRELLRPCDGECGQTSPIQIAASHCTTLKISSALIFSLPQSCCWCLSQSAWWWCLATYTGQR